MIPSGKSDGDVRAASLDQAAHQQGALPPRMASILIPELGVFLAQVKGFTHGRPCDQVVGLALEAVHRFEIARRIDLAAHFVEVVEKRTPVFEAVDRQAFGELNVLDFEIGRVGIATRFERVVFDAKVLRRTK